MAKIGSYGSVIFEISSKKHVTFSEFEEEISPRWHDHEIIMKKPKSEFIGPGLEEFSISIKLSVSLGINPEKYYNMLKKMAYEGKVAMFIIGGKPISSNYWGIRNMKTSKKSFLKGTLSEAEVTLTLKEYALRRRYHTPTKPSTGTKPPTNTKALGKITITVKSVHIRSGPSTSAKILKYVFKGDTLTVLSVKNGWYSLGQGKYITANSAYSTLKKG